mmetsp:Transcript_24755/g.44026  ORF Transcript_24755/g.44026 Transcript_24755/m.44026 type:complete len:550 (+) Transcript_24755:218-1867(+)
MSKQKRKLYLKILGFPEKARPTSEEIRSAYKRKALKWHPDKNDDPDANDVFQQLAKAMEFFNETGKNNEGDYSCGATSSTNLGNSVGLKKKKKKKNSAAALSSLRECPVLIDDGNVEDESLATLTPVWICSECVEGENVCGIGVSHEEHICFCAHKLSSHNGDGVACSSYGCMCMKFAFSVNVGSEPVSCKCSHQHTDHVPNSPRQCKKCECDTFSVEASSAKTNACPCGHAWGSHKTGFTKKRYAEGSTEMLWEHVAAQDTLISAREQEKLIREAHLQRRREVKAQREAWKLAEQIRVEMEITRKREKIRERASTRAGNNRNQKLNHHKKYSDTTTTSRKIHSQHNSVGAHTHSKASKARVPRVDKGRGSCGRKMHGHGHGYGNNDDHTQWKKAEEEEKRELETMMHRLRQMEAGICAPPRVSIEEFVAERKAKEAASAAASSSSSNSRTKNKFRTTRSMQETSKMEHKQERRSGSGSGASRFGVTSSTTRRSAKKSARSGADSSGKKKKTGYSGSGSGSGSSLLFVFFYHTPALALCLRVLRYYYYY